MAGKSKCNYAVGVLLVSTIGHLAREEGHEYQQRPEIERGVEAMRLHLLGSARDWATLSSQGVLRNRRAGEAAEFKVPYDWFKNEMVKRIGKPPAQHCYPMWAYVRWEGKEGLDLREHRWHYPKGRAMARIECECPDELVLPALYDVWIYAINHWYVPSSMEDAERFERRYSPCPYGIDNSLKYRNAAFHRAVIASWQKMFDLKLHVPSVCDSKNKSIIGWVWEVRKEWVISHTAFSGGTVDP